LRHRFCYVRSRTLLRRVIRWMLLV
jgi:hypothetical protein